ncbi:MAG TPA: glycosyltransferase, partial [Gammaproteobacteria bacterium]|nr:glycosyltransferase [Gammaproteobacteria bacterium]
MTAGRGLDIVLFDDFAPHGGAPRVLANMIPYWVDAGFRVGLVGYRKGVCFYPEEMRDWVTFRNLGTRGKWTTAFALWRFLRRERPRVILGSSHLGNTILARLGSLPSTGTRRFGGVHNTYGQSNRRDPRKKRKKLEKVLRLYPKLDGVITVSEGSRKDLVENVGLDNVPVYAIPNGVVTPQTEAKGEMAVDH